MTAIPLLIISASDAYLHTELYKRKMVKNNNKINTFGKNISIAPYQKSWGISINLKSYLTYSDNTDANKTPSISHVTNRIILVTGICKMPIFTSLMLFNAFSSCF